ncbi:hypothetical protein C8E87_8105 [Paractinoplanes brasiliensis]|uniref:NACHT domain-containing protein n=2 Tax=Paractinoplanes brasiliensis TaxID=52695 RepID=A0A4R6JDM9_9ACTN|nr:hypothetical protein C8E87_8105 [Actinoplanes brasiliensis]GID33465.1 hypothetical protein Abr02nite_84480 [Actinoplanes brasiliensis]
MIIIDQSAVRVVSIPVLEVHHCAVPNWFTRPRVWFLIMLVAATLAAMLLAWFLRSEGLERADKWSGVVFGSVSALAVCVGTLTWLWRLGNADAGSEREVVLARMAKAQREQWTAEQAARRVGEPWPLNVTWAVTAGSSAVMAGWASVLQKAGAGPVDVQGDYARVAAVFDRDDVPRRLVMLGEPGAGKSLLAVHLTVQMLARRRPGAPVTVLLSAASWNPVQPLDDWIADQLIAQDRRLATTVPGPNATSRSLARDLVAGGFVLPVLDGLDELDDERQRAALIGLSHAAVAGREFVVTCRTQPYKAAVSACGPIPATVVAELLPIPSAEAAQHLADSATADDLRWSPVLEHLQKAGRAPLTRALSTPLMIWLARTVYQDRERDPSELLTARWAASKEGIEQHLLEHLIPAVYADRRGAAAGITETRWLATLARHLREQRTFDLAWWRIAEIHPVPTAQVVSIVYVILVSLYCIFAAVLGGISMTNDSLPPLQVTINIGTGLGLLAAFGRMIFSDLHLPRRVSLRGSLRLFLVVAAPLMLVASLMARSLAIGAVLAVTVGLITALASGAEPAPIATSPLTSIATDRTAAMVSAATIGAVEVVLQAQNFGLANPLTWLLAAMAALAAVLLHSWGQYCLATVVLSASRRLPVYLTRSLADAHKRGVLRSAGSVYQFRHGLIRDRIAVEPISREVPATGQTARSSADVRPGRARPS